MIYPLSLALLFFKNPFQPQYSTLISSSHMWLKTEIAKSITKVLMFGKHRVSELSYGALQFFFAIIAVCAPQQYWGNLYC